MHFNTANLAEQRQRTTVEGFRAVSTKTSPPPAPAPANINGKNRSTGSISGATIQTGEKTPLWMDDKRQEERKKEAEEFYEDVRNSKELSKIVESSGLSLAEIEQFRNHVFFDRHHLYDGYERFEADYDMTVAWKRLSAGIPEKRDIVLLKLESQIEASNPSMSLSEAHVGAQLKYNCEQLIFDELGEEGEPDGLLQEIE